MDGSIISVQPTNYGEAVREGFRHLLAEHEEVFAIGQGLWSPWYVGSSMTDLDREFGTERIIDTPVSENACTGAAVGASLSAIGRSSFTRAWILCSLRPTRS